MRLNEISNCLLSKLPWEIESLTNKYVRSLDGIAEREVTEKELTWLFETRKEIILTSFKEDSCSTTYYQTQSPLLGEDGRKVITINTWIDHKIQYDGSEVTKEMESYNHWCVEQVLKGTGLSIKLRTNNFCNMQLLDVKSLFMLAKRRFSKVTSDPSYFTKIVVLCLLDRLDKIIVMKREDIPKWWYQIEAYLHTSASNMDLVCNNYVYPCWSCCTQSIWDAIELM